MYKAHNILCREHQALPLGRAAAYAAGPLLACGDRCWYGHVPRIQEWGIALDLLLRQKS